MWEEIETQIKLRLVLLRRQNLTTLDIFYGTIRVREDLARKIVEESNKTDEGFNWWLEKGA
jgi:hypothetical protein